MTSSPSASPVSQRPQAIILAAGKGTRMGAQQPKVLFPAAGMPLVWWVIQACRQVGVTRCVLVVGYGGELVRQALAGEAGICFVEQKELLGTGHATMMAQPLFAQEPPCDAFVLYGDAPLIRPATLATLLDTHRRTAAAATLATARLDDPTGYGRIVRDGQGRFAGIVEQKDASPQQRQITEINPGYYCFRSHELFAALARTDNRNQQGEYYLTDVPAILLGQGRPVSVVEAVPAEDVLGVNNPQQLDQVDQILRRRLPGGTAKKEAV